MSGSGPARAWTPEMTDFLLRLRRRGESYRRIARMLGTTRAACVARAVEMGLLVRAGVLAKTARTPEPPALGGMGAILDGGVCHWVAGDTGAPGWRMCGHPSVHGSLWCAHHLARARPGQARP